jgi:hypothetical protein
MPAKTCLRHSYTPLHTCEAFSNAGTGIGVVVLMILWFFGFLFLSLIWLMTKPRTRLCPVCGEKVKRGLTVGLPVLSPRLRCRRGCGATAAGLAAPKDLAAITAMQTAFPALLALIAFDVLPVVASGLVMERLPAFDLEGRYLF